MNWVLAAAIYITCWFVLLFILLPIGIQAETNPVPGQSLGAPRRVFWKWKLLANSGISLAATALIMLLMAHASWAASSSPLAKGPMPKANANAPASGPVIITPCRDRVPHSPAPDVAYQEGVDAHGNKITGADLGMPAAAMRDLQNPEISLYAPLSGLPQVPAGGTQSGTGVSAGVAGQRAANRGAETYAQFGTIDIVGNQAMLNGVPLVQPDACPQ